jgi:FlaA1/EpsC-like NDP-sugar epimerase
MMSLDDSCRFSDVLLLERNPGIILCKKSPTSTIEDLAQALKNCLMQTAEIKKIIGERHAEKCLWKRCVQREMPKADDLGNFIEFQRIFDLNYTEVFGKRS